MTPAFPAIDFERFHREELPRRIAARGAEAAAAAARLGSLAFRRKEGGAFTYAARDGSISIAPGDEAADTVIEIDHACWEGMVHELETPPGLIYAGRVRSLRGSAMKLVGWELPLRVLYHGRSVYRWDALALRDRRGEPLDPEQVFTLASDREDMAHFLRTCGYLFVRQVFSSDEIAAFLDEARELTGEAVKGDKLSWWGRNAAGEEILCRVTRAGAKPHLATLPGDPRLLALKDLADEELVQRAAESTEGVSVIYKHPDMKEGLGDIPWHRDCGMGGHASMCPVLIASVYLTPATPETGELRMLPGSHRGAVGFFEASDPAAPRGAGFCAAPGDLSLHYGDVMHVAPPPRGRGLDAYRVSAITGYARPTAYNHRGDKNYNVVLHEREDGQVEHLAKVAARR